MSGKFWKHFHLIAVFFFIVLWGAAAVLGWIQSVTFVAHVSMVALVLAELSAWQAARVETKQDKKENSTGD